jgi:hypothetical protein
MTTPEGKFLELTELDLERLQTVWHEAVFAPPRSTGCPIPPKGAQLIRNCGWHSNKARRMRRGTRLRVAAEAAAAALEPAVASSSSDAGPVPARSRSSQAWAACLPTGRC